MGSLIFPSIYKLWSIFDKKKNKEEKFHADDHLSVQQVPAATKNLRSQKTHQWTDTNFLFALTKIADLNTPIKNTTKVHFECCDGCIIDKNAPPP